MTRCVFAIPGDLSTPTGGYAYARNILPPLSASVEVEVCTLPGGFPLPDEPDLSRASEALRLAGLSCDVLLIDGLAFGALPASLIATLSVPIVALVHHPLGLEEGLSEHHKSCLLASERNALQMARHIVVSSSATARTLSELFEVPIHKVTVAEPGILRGPRAKGSSPGHPLHVVSVGTLTPRKGYSVLFDALRAIRDLQWYATIAGSLDRSPATTIAIREQLAALHLTERVNLAGSLDEGSISALYASADIFALASLYEGYGMAFAEAMAHGLPIVASGDGAVADTVPAEAGFVCPSRDVPAIAAALRALLSDSTLRRRKADAAWRHGLTLPAWENTAATISSVLRYMAP